MNISDNIWLERYNHLMSDALPHMNERLGESLRLRFWEIADSFKCPVIGWCLDIPEQREILKKEGIAVKGKNDFQVHEIVVNSLEIENRISHKLDLWLNRKYKNEVKDLSGLEQRKFIRQWKASLSRGQVEGILWVAVTRTDLSAETKRDIFGDVHMEMHVRARQIGKERQRLVQEKERGAILSKTVKEAKRTIRTLKRENEKLRNELNEIHELCTTLKRQNLALEEGQSTPGNESSIASLQKENKELKDEAESLSEQLLSRQTELKSLQKRNRKLVTKLNEQYQNEVRLREELGSMITRFAALRSPYDSNPSVDLNQSRILIVGGLPKMASLYRRLIEENGGTFEYHDGQVNRGTKGLEQQVRRADLILCHIDHNSHGAASVVKKLGKKYKKPIRMLSNSGLSTISQMVLGI
jgi:hypothetical protein